MRHYEFIMTCSVCPEQYDVYDRTKNIKVAYVRYRFGHLTVYTYNPNIIKTKELWNDDYVEKQEINWDNIIYEHIDDNNLLGALNDNTREETLNTIDDVIYKYYNKE